MRSSPRPSRGCGRSTPEYADGREDAFYLFHRPRRWNPQRGRVDGLGAEARQAGGVQPVRAGAAGTRRFSRRSWATWSRSASVRYVITLDADTVLPPDAAPLLVGALAHPLNRAVYDPALGRVVRGYGILQPRVGVSLPSAHRSRFAAIHSGHPGVDPYTTAVSDVYQDLYGEGSFTGKGIYDVDGVRAARRTAASREHPAVARPDRGELRARRPRHRHHRLRRLSRRAISPSPAASTAGSAATGSSSAGSRARVPGPDGPRAQPAVAALPLEDRRQPAPQHGRAGAARLPRRRLDRAARRRRSAGRCSGCGAIAAPWIVSLLLALVRPPLDKSWRAYYARGGAATRSPAPSRWRSPRVPAAPGVGLGRRDRAHALAPVGIAAATCSSGRRRRRPSAAVTDAARLGLARDVARRGAARRLVARAGVCWRVLAPGRLTAAGARRAPSVPLLLALDRSSPSVAYALSAPVVRARAPAAADEPDARRCATRCCTGATSTASSPRRPTGWRRTISRRPRAGRGDAHLADEHRAAAAGHGERLRPGLHHARGHGRGGWSSPFGRSSGCGASAATSTTGTICAISACWSRPTSRRWTAATSPAT